MRVLMVEPGKMPYETEIEPGYESLQAVVGGIFQAVYPFDDPVGVICDDESKLNRKPLNRALYDNEGNIYDILAGDFLVVGLKEDRFDSLPDDLMEKYKERFKHPETFHRIAGQIIAVKQPLPGEPGQGVKPPATEI